MVPRSRWRGRSPSSARCSTCPTSGPGSRCWTTRCPPAPRPSSTWSAAGCSTGRPGGCFSRAASCSTSRPRSSTSATSRRSSDGSRRCSAGRRPSGWPGGPPSWSPLARRTSWRWRRRRCWTPSRCSTSCSWRARRGSRPSRWATCTSRCPSSSRWTGCWAGSRRCRATTAGPPWPGWRCATTCTGRWPDSPATCWPPPPGRPTRTSGSPSGRQENAEGLARARATLQEIATAEAFDLATLSVAMRVIRTLVPSGSSA